jgi:hypothetical protein
MFPTFDEVLKIWNGEGKGHLLCPHTEREIETAREVYNITQHLWNKIQDETFGEFLERTEGI